MATLAPPSNLTADFERSLAVATAQSVRSVRRHLEQVDAKAIAGDWPAVARRITRDITQGQQAAVVLSSWYLQEAVRATVHVASTPPDLPDYAGRTVSGMSVGQYVARTPDIVAARIDAGVKPDLAYAISERRLTSLAATEPYRIGRAAVAYASVNDANYAGWQRIAEAGACDFCQMLTTRGGAYTSKASAELTSQDLAFHNNCRCYAEPVLAAAGPAVQAAGEQAWAANADQPVISRTGARSTGRSRPRAATRPRIDTSLYRPGSGTPERLAAIDLQIGQVEQRLAEMSTRLDAGDASMARPVAWNNARLADLRAERARY